MHYPPFTAMANLLVRSEKQEEALRMSAELGRLLTPAPEKIKMMGPAEAPVPRLKNEFRYQLLIKAASRKALNDLLPARSRFCPGSQMAGHGAGDRRGSADADVRRGYRKV